MLCDASPSLIVIMRYSCDSNYSASCLIDGNFCQILHLFPVTVTFDTDKLCLFNTDVVAFIFFIVTTAWTVYICECQLH